MNEVFNPLLTLRAEYSGKKVEGYRLECGKRLYGVIQSVIQIRLQKIRLNVALCEDVDVKAGT